MKKVISLMLSLIFLFSSLSMLVYADGTVEEEELTNIAMVENALPYASSEKNTLWTPAKALNDGAKSADTWQGWECQYPDIVYGSDTSKGFSGEYCGIKFTKSEYYEISKINLNLGMHAAMGGQNPHYVVQCLVEGVWVTVAEFNDSDTKPVSYETYEDAMANDKSFYHIPTNIEFTLDNPVTTNNVRITISEFAKNYPSGDVLIFPYVYEIELIGKRGETPDIELPEGAVISTNIGYHSFPEASSSRPFKYPYRAIDGDVKTEWTPRSRDAGQYLLLDLLQTKKINKVVVNCGEYMDGVSVSDYAYDIKAYVNNEWVTVAQGTVFDEANMSLVNEYTFNTVETNLIKLEFTEALTSLPSVYELEAHLSEDKTYYVEGRYSAAQRVSASKGNIAIAGTPYASHDFIPYSSVDYIIDGGIDNDAYVWFSGVLDMPVHCGIKFHAKQLINKIAVYVHVPEEEGTDIMGIEIQAFIDGEYKTIVKSKSYDKLMKYTTVYEFDPIETDDIRIVYTSGSGTFANLRELEIYSPSGILPMFDGLEAMAEPPQVIKGEPMAQQREATEKSEGKIISTSIKDLLGETNSKENAPDTQGSQQAINSTEVFIIAISVVGAIALICLAVFMVKRSKKTD